MAKFELYSVFVPNKPGKGAHLLSAFKEAGVNFVGIWGYPVGKSKSMIDMVAEDAALLKRAAKQLKIKLGKKQTAFHITGDWRHRRSTSTRSRPSAPATAVLAHWFRFTRTTSRRLQKL